MAVHSGALSITGRLLSVEARSVPAKSDDSSTTNSIERYFDDTNTRLRSLREEEDRERANVTALKDSDKSASSRFVRDLNETEDKLRAAQTKLDNRTAALNAANADLSNAVENLEVDTGTKD